MAYADEYNYESIKLLKGKLKKTTTVFFGASEMGETLLKEFKDNDIEIDYFCDNDCKKWGKKLLGVNVISPKDLKTFPKNINIVISSMYVEEIYLQLLKLGFINIYTINIIEVISEDGKEYDFRDFFNSEEVINILTKNKVYKSKYKEKRAFLLATGPSIKMENMKLLQGEDCYSLSNFFLHEDINNINPKIHFFAPYHKPLILENYIQWLSIADKKLPKETEIFLEISMRRFVEDFNIFKNRNVNYLKFTCNPDKRDVDITNSVLWPHTGPIMILPVLIYMGYTKIYLLGCDHTVLRDYGKTTTNFYANNEETRINATNEKAWFGIIEYLEATKCMFQQYAFYKDIMNKKQIQIVNLSRDSWLDIFNFKLLENVIKNKKN